MKYYSLNRQSPPVDFKTATIQGQAPDGGLYFPEAIPRLAKQFIDSLASRSRTEIAYDIIRPYVEENLPDDVLWKIVEETINFQIPLVRVTNNIYSLELYHGPTLAFKDIGARFMSRCLGHFVKDGNRKVTVLVATSGDTGGAVANGFHGVEGIEVVILYPSGRVSPVQEQQLTTLGSNIRAIEINGNFDDCQQLVKKAFADTEVRSRLFLTSANSINIARWLPQQFYYFFALQQWMEDSAPVIAVPSGNFGNICAGVLAYASGLPVKHFVAACNANQTIPKYLLTGKYIPEKAIATLSNAMDVADPSNFVRVLELFGQQMPELQKMMSSESISDEQTRAAISRLYNVYAYLPDPHGAVAFAALENYLEQRPAEKAIFLETAHPVKFAEVVQQETRSIVEIPSSLEQIMKAKKEAVKMEPVYDEFKSYLLA